MKKAALLLLASIMISGCATRHKEKHEEKSTYKFTSAVDTSFNFKAQLHAGKELAQQQQSSFSNMSIEYEGKAGDSLIIEETGPDGRTTKTIIRGKGKGSINKGEAASTSQTKEKTTSSQDIHFEASGAQELSAVAETRIKDKKMERTGFTWHEWLWVPIILIILIVRWFRRRYREINL